MVVRMRHTRSQTRQRRSHHQLARPALIVCECGAMRRKHMACPSCGRYRGRVVIDVAAKASAKAAKRQERTTGSRERTTSSEPK